MYTFLCEWVEHTNRDNRNAAIRAMESFFEQVRPLSLSLIVIATYRCPFLWLKTLQKIETHIMLSSKN